MQTKVWSMILPAINHKFGFLLLPERYTFGPLVKKMLKTPQITDVLGLKSSATQKSSRY